MGNNLSGGSSHPAHNQTHQSNNANGLYGVGTNGETGQYAWQTKEGLKVVVKIREKRVSFKDSSDISQWRKAMCNLMIYQCHFKSGFVAEVVDILEDSSNFYVLMEMVNGIDLFEFLHRLKIVDDQARAVFLCKVAYQLTAALRDFSPSNPRKEGNPDGLSLDQIRGMGTQLVHKDLKLENVVLDDDKSGMRAVLKV